jgi:hypothetical protein
MLISCLAYSSTLKIRAVGTSETSVDFHRTSPCYIPEDKILRSHRCENLKSKIEIRFSQQIGLLACQKEYPAQLRARIRRNDSSGTELLKRLYFASYIIWWSQVTLDYMLYQWAQKRLMCPSPTGNPNNNDIVEDDSVYCYMKLCPRKLAQILTHLSCIRKVPRSDLSLDADYPEWSLSCYFWVPPSKCRGN